MLEKQIAHIKETGEFSRWVSAVEDQEMMEVTSRLDEATAIKYYFALYWVPGSPNEVYYGLCNDMGVEPREDCLYPRMKDELLEYDWLLDGLQSVTHHINLLQAWMGGQASLSMVDAAATLKYIEIHLDSLKAQLNKQRQSKEV